MRKLCLGKAGQQEREGAGSHRNLGCQATGKVEILTEPAGCWHPTPTIPGGLPGPDSPQVGAPGLSQMTLTGEAADSFLHFVPAYSGR